MRARAPARQPRVVLADDHPTMLNTVRAMLTPHVDIVAAVRDGRSAVAAVLETNPDLFLSDIMMPGLNGFETARELKQRRSPAAVVFLTGQKDDDFISEALAIGADGYVFKRRMSSDLVPALNSVFAGQYFISPHAFAGTQKQANSGHVMEFYLDENSFLDRMSESISTALANGDVVFIFLSSTGLSCLAERLSIRGIDVIEANRAGKCVVLCVEAVIPFLSRYGWPDARRFEAYFNRGLECAAARASKTGAKARVFSDMMTSLLRQYHHQSLAIEVEAIWNDLVSRHSCVVHCGCPAMHLSSDETRQTLSKICGAHCNVIPIDK